MSIENMCFGPWFSHKGHQTTFVGFLMLVTISLCTQVPWRTRQKCLGAKILSKMLFFEAMPLSSLSQHSGSPHGHSPAKNLANARRNLKTSQERAGPGSHKTTWLCLCYWPTEELVSPRMALNSKSATSPLSLRQFKPCNWYAEQIKLIYFFLSLM